MRSRQDITELFSTFAQLEADRFRKWLTDPKLCRSIKKCLDHYPEALNAENFWAIYWYKHWYNQSQSLAKMHLSAYLQEQCYWAAQKTVAKFTLNQYGLADYFQLANAEVENILKGFKPEISNNLQAYAKMAIPTRLRDILRQRKEADSSTNWALLRKVSKKQVLASLSHAGLSPAMIAQYRLAWFCFKELYVPNPAGANSKLPEPNRQLWEAIANLYNSERLNQLSQQAPQCSIETIEQLLTRTATYLRDYLYPPVSSLDALKSEDDSNITLDLPDPSSDSLIADILAQEEAQNRQEQLSQINAVLLKALQGCNAQTQEIIKLYYQQGVTQQDIIKQLQISQPTVSRRLIKARESLLATLINWSQETLNISMTSNQIKDMSNVLEEWLRSNYNPT
ncbi:sigma-70 family RNA polymerase sigma factor [Calothrix sp. FACHB-1219]|uniref:sigma-70 family RNA polymerase sigma factor n=1 Tax=unclassified Calothrix TaxID=2619626 RepID=UPI001686C3FD|nr:MULTISPECIES: sigma-70 family RNA polymerase sigma factor [unclassified Calothrix]MBD2206474.1 sigma-70 family RNA polymerase sigma factor [Calothrix sp. FACHB-168]MBD2220351.1 sigma-70 family RNA polymerase sigma factor [Calothrix sp. FACHB-1219]